MQRIKEIDNLRGLAIIGVILVHVSAFYYTMSALNLLNYSLRFVNILSHYAVPLFIFISGFVLYNKYSNKINLKEFFTKRFRYTIPPYLIWSIIFIAITGLTDVLFKIVSFSGYFHLWFFAILFQFYLLFPFIKNLYQKYPKTILISSLFLQITWNIFSSFEGFWMPRIFLAKIFYFILGFYVVENICKVKKINVLAPLIIVTGSMTIIMLTWFDYGQIRLMILEPFFVTSLFYLGYKLCKGRFWEELGKKSYGIYLIHALFHTYLWRLFGGFSLGWMIFPILFITVLITSYLSVIIIKKLPFSKYLIGPN